MDDEAIIELFNSRQEQAIIELDSKYGKLFKAISYNILHNSEDVSECINDAYLAVWRKIPPAHPNPLFAYECVLIGKQAVRKGVCSNWLAPGLAC